MYVNQSPLIVIIIYLMRILSVKHLKPNWKFQLKKSSNHFHHLKAKQGCKTAVSVDPHVQGFYQVKVLHLVAKSANMKYISKFTGYDVDKLHPALPKKCIKV